MKLKTGSVFYNLNSGSIPGSLLCDGSSLNVTNYKKLYELIGYTYKSTASGDFKIPLLTNRFIRCADRNSAGATTGVDVGPRWGHNYAVGLNPTPVSNIYDIGSNQYHSVQAHKHQNGTIPGSAAVWPRVSGTVELDNNPGHLGLIAQAGEKYTSSYLQSIISGFYESVGNTTTYPDNKQLRTFICYEDMYVPISTIIPFSGSTIPDGWLLCNGSAIPSGCTELIANIGGTLPDLSNVFIQSMTTTQLTIVPNKLQIHKHVINNPGGQEDAYLLNSGTKYEWTVNGSSCDFAGFYYLQDPNNYPATSGGTPRPDTEVRPKTTQINWIIKY